MGSDCNGGVGDPSMVILNTIEQIRDTVTLFNSEFFNISEQFINITTRAGEEDLVFLDGQPILSFGVNYTTLGNAGDFAYVTVPVSPGAHTIYTQGCGIIAMAYGYGDIESYAYSGGAAFLDINENQIPKGGCVNDTVFFDSGLPPVRYNVTWDLGDGTSSEEHEFQHVYTELGDYQISLIIEDVCLGEIDTNERELIMTLREEISAVESASGCAGTDVQLEAFDVDGATYEWVGPQDYYSEEQFPVIQDITRDQAGVYQVVSSISGCKSLPRDVVIEVFDDPSPDLGPDKAICPLDSEFLTLEVGSFTSFLWQDGSTAATLPVLSAGEYSVEVIDDNGCLGSDSLVVIQQCPTQLYVPNAFSPNQDGTNDLFGVFGIDVISMELRVFDTWGELVFFSQSEDQLWDGTFKDDKVEQGTYVWTLSFEGYDGDGQVYQDTITGISTCKF